MRLATSHRVGIVIAALLTAVAAATLFAISQRFQNALEHQRVAEDIRKSVTALHEVLTDQLAGRGALGTERWHKEGEQLHARIEALTRLGGRAREVEKLSRDLNFATVIFARLSVGVGQTDLSAAAIEELRAQQAGVLRAATESLLSTAETVDRQGRRILDQLGVAQGALALGFALLLLASLFGYMTIIRIRVLRPLEQLGATMASVGEHGASSAFRYPREDELGDLSRGFNAMLSQLGAARDELVRKTAESTRFALRARMSQRLRYQGLLIEAAHEAIIVREFSGRVLQWNHGATELYAIPAAQALGKPLSALIQSQEIEPGAVEPAAQLLKATGRWRGELRQRTGDGRELIVACEQLLLDISALPKEEEEEEEEEQDSGLGLVLEVHHDITEKKKSADLIQASLTEKETLLQEIHHRVKNNLQIVSSLLQLQGERVQDAGLRAVFSETEGRVRSMALVHERLYREHTFSSLDFSQYLETLAGQLLESLRSEGTQVELELACEPLRLPVDTAIPLGLITTELITNAIKYAFRGRPGGVLRIALRQTGEGRHELAISDDGPGLPPGLDPATTRSLGMRLVTMLARQIRGEATYARGPGAGCRVSFLTQNRGTQP